jgi:glycosyltransferase involved in cell wall biosynthesis
MASAAQARPGGSKIEDVRNTHYLHVWTGDRETARALLDKHRHAAPVVELSHQELRAGGWRKPFSILSKLRGRALVVFFRRVEEAPQLPLVLWSGLVHRCRETIVADSAGQFRVYRRADWFRLLPETIVSAIADIAVLGFSLLLLGAWKALARPIRVGSRPTDLGFAYLLPFPLMRDSAGGAMSHIRGVLSGIRANGESCEVFAANPVRSGRFPLRLVPPKRKRFIFWETMLLSYNLRFAWQARRMLRGRRPAVIYQRHGRFNVAGALLSQCMRVPIVLEYNGSEIWMAEHWDPTRFKLWLRVCEEFALACASKIVVVSEPSRDELLQRGVPAERVLVNPNAVDPEVFRPNCGGDELRRSLGIRPGECVIAFVGTFGPWHGIPVLQAAIQQLLADSQGVSYRFLLVGDGLLRNQMREELADYERDQRVAFPGIVPPDEVRRHLDASDILVSPHVPMPDGRPFFGSPTKLFEYLAMEKPIIASNLDQLAQVLRHEHSALLVEPGNPADLVHAIRRLAADPELRRRLGTNARQTAIAHHTWKHNVTTLMRAVFTITNAAGHEPELVRNGVNVSHHPDAA